jgi:maleylacetate reductase
MAGDTAPLSAVMPAPFARTSLPGRIVFGDGAVTRLADELDQHDLRQVMLITASRDAQLGEHGRKALGDRIRLHWEEVRQHVPRELAQQATSAAREAGADVLVAIGGGSTTGLGKAVAVATGLPLAVVPTTYAGSEMTPIYGLTSDNDKVTVRDARALPKIVVYDPRLLTTLPAAVVGPSGLNALAHCAEALWAASADPVTDAIALDGAKRLRQHLPAAYASDHPAARGEVLIAACLAGMALGTVGTSLHHALCHLLGGMFDAPTPKPTRSCSRTPSVTCSPPCPTRHGGWPRPWTPASTPWPGASGNSASPSGHRSACDQSASVKTSSRHSRKPPWPGSSPALVRLSTTACTRHCTPPGLESRRAPDET